MIILQWRNIVSVDILEFFLAGTKLNPHFLHKSNHSKPCIRKMRFQVCFRQFSALHFEKIIQTRKDKTTCIHGFAKEHSRFHEHYFFSPYLLLILVLLYCKSLKYNLINCFCFLLALLIVFSPVKILSPKDFIVRNLLKSHTFLLDSCIKLFLLICFSNFLIF